MTINTPAVWLVHLDDPAAFRLDVAGTKAATLAKLRAGGLPVPPGIVITVDGCREWQTTAGRDGVIQDLRGALERLGDRPLAVRSSGVAEDLAGASFAGQYETVLGVRGIDAVVDAVSQCLASTGRDLVSAYLASNRVVSDSSMAVLIQPLLDAKAAGVAFTANPLTGDRNEIVVSAVRGLGERLVSGQATPDEWLVRGDQAHCVERREDAVGAAAVLAVAQLAAQVEAVFNEPQDIEWAIDNEQLWLLQARPITALPKPPQIEIPAQGFWTKDDQHYSAPLTPFGASVYMPAVEQGVLSMIEDFGLLFEGMNFQLLGGEVYFRIVPLGGKDRRAPPWWVLAIVSRLLPVIRHKDQVARRALEANLAERLIERWQGDWRDAFLAEAAALRTTDIRALADDKLLAYLDATIDLLRRGEAMHFRLFFPYVSALYGLDKTCIDLLGWSPAESLQLVAGTSETSSEPARALSALAATIRESPAAEAIVLDGGDDILDRLRATAPDVAVLVDGYLERHGHRPLSYDPSDVTLAERPALFAQLLGDHLRQVGRPAAGTAVDRREAALAEARGQLAERTAKDSDRFEHALALAQRAYPIREDNIFIVGGLPSGLVRRAVVEIGRRLAERDALIAADDVVFLEDSEVRAALAGDLTASQTLVERRRAERAWVIAHPGPASYGPDPGPPPDIRGLPRSLRYVMSMAIWLTDLELPKAAARDDSASIMRGVAGSPGRYTGPVCVLREESEFGRLRPGDVLVCPIASPAWSVLFAHAGALVTDGGGILAHAAIVAREYGIPAVLATRDGTRRLRDGDLVTVDGTNGTVLLVASEEVPT